MIRVSLCLFFLLLSGFFLPVLSQIQPGESIQFNFRDDFFRIDKYDVSTSSDQDTLLVVTAYDSSGAVNERIEGQYPFVINGILSQLSFTKGIAPVNIKLDGSSFMYVKHENTAGKQTRLYYVFEGKDSKTPVPIPLWLILIVPLGLMLILFLFTRIWIILLVIVFLVVVFLMNGLDFHTFRGMIADSFMSLFR